jgi:5-hydroxyisourate hydrolase
MISALPDAITPIHFEQFLEDFTMGLSTHVLDTMHGTPAAGMAVALFATRDEVVRCLKRIVLNQDGRNPEGLLLEATELQRGSYRLVFEVAAYFKARGVVLPEPNFLNQVTLDFGVADPAQHYHVPLLVSPWSYATYRGS